MFRLARIGRVGGAAVVLALTLGPTGGRAQTIRDSAGIEIVENDRPAWPAGKGWRVGAPALRLGGSRASSEAQFSGVIAVARTGAGRILVGDRRNHRVVIFDQRGQKVGQFGRQGQGPGEFRDITRIIAIEADSIVIPATLTGFAVFDPDGKFVRNGEVVGDSIAPGVRLPPAVLGSLPGGRWLALKQAVSRPTAGENADSFAVYSLERSGGGGRLLGKHFAWSRRGHPQIGSLQIAFGPRGMVLPAPAGYCHGDRARFEISCYDESGKLKRIVRRAVATRPVSSDLKDRYRRFITSMPVEPGMENNARMREHRRLLAENTPFATSLPAFSMFFVDSEGHLWVKHYSPDEEMPNIVDFMSTPLPREATSWSVFDPPGRFLGTVTLPAGFAVRQVGRDFVLGLARDEADEEQVWLLPLTR